MLHEAQEDLKQLQSEGGEGTIVHNEKGGENGYYVKIKSGFMYVNKSRFAHSTEGLGVAVSLVVSVVPGGVVLRGAYMLYSAASKFTMVYPAVASAGYKIIERLDGYYGGGSPTVNYGTAAANRYMKGEPYPKGN